MQHGRLPWFEPSELDPEQQQLYEAIVGGPRAAMTRTSAMLDESGRLNGPFNALLIAPAVGDAVQNLGARVRFSSSLADRAREIATLEVARLHESEYEWCAHERLGRTAGLSDEELQAIRTGGAAASFSSEEGLIRRVVRILVEEARLTDALFATAEEQLGREALFHLIVLVGHYELLSRLLAVYEVPLPRGSDPIFNP